MAELGDSGSCPSRPPMDDLLQILLNGLSVGAVYALFALGYTLVFSVLGVINFAHGAIFTLGPISPISSLGAGWGAMAC